MKATQEMIEANREVISHVGENQILFVQYGAEWQGIAQVKQVSKKAGKGGDTALLIRFMDSNKLLRLSWRDENLLAVKPLELEEIRAYFQPRG